MKEKMLAGFIALLIILAIAILPSAAQDEYNDIETTVTIASYGGDIPIVKVKWEQDDTDTLEDGDPLHEEDGSQFLPPCEYEEFKDVQYYAIVTDAQDMGDVQGVYVHIYHPEPPFGDGSLKYQIHLVNIGNDADVRQEFTDAYEAGLVTFNTEYDYIDYAEVMNELNKGDACVWKATEGIHYHQPAGDYKVEVTAKDQQNNPSIVLINHFKYVFKPCFQIDFNSVFYGNINVQQHTPKSGDTIWAPPESDNPTVRNVGNVPIKLQVQQDDMGFGKDSDSNWNIEFDARIGHEGIGYVDYFPEELATIPDRLPPCNTDELDFSIYVEKGDSGTTYTGDMVLSCFDDSPYS